MAFLKALDRLTVIGKELQKTFGAHGGLIDEEYEEETKDSSPWNDDNDNLTREHVYGQLATNTKSHPCRICVLILQINLKLMLI